MPLDTPYSIRFWITLLLSGFFAALLVGIVWKARGKKIEKRPTIWQMAGALLLIWSGFDFFYVIRSGEGLTAGLVKVALGCAVLAAGRLRSRPPVRSLTAVTALLSGIVLTIWVVSMGLLTAAAAEFGAYQVRKAGDPWIDQLTGMLDANLDRWDDRSNGREMAFQDAVSVGPPSVRSINDDQRFLPMWDRERLYAASAVYDREGNLLAASWQDSMYFQYMSEEAWDAGEYHTPDLAIADLDRNCLTEQGQISLVGFSGLSQRADAVRLTGTFDGDTFVPARIEGVLWEDVWEVLMQRGGGSYILSQVVQDAGLPWYLLYEDPAVPEAVTIYADYLEPHWAEDSPAFSYKGEAYPDLAALMEELGPTLAPKSPEDPDQYQWRDQVEVSVRYHSVYEEGTYWASYHLSDGAYSPGEAPAVEYYLVNIVYASPLRNAFWTLWKLYAWTFVLAVVLILAGRTVLRRQLIRPAQSVGKALLEGSDTADRRYNEEWRWQEGEDLLRGFLDNRDRCQIQKNEVNRLTAALTYAKTAEENRRQMTSSIAHELKTPLAVVHSYAEGLKEHIAEEKRDKYLDVILSETERMDAMVLEMLDLSRLEAGKIKLARDQFDLAALTRSVWEKLSRAAEAKNLQVTLKLPETCPITADESRIGQVVENFLSNAVKYTPAGGKITIAIEAGRQRTGFFVDNDSPPLSEEALSKVWDTFYRADEARSGGGTGLGLAIARSIIELHGGKCAVRNTKTGVQFSFSL